MGQTMVTMEDPPTMAMATLVLVVIMGIVATMAMVAILPIHILQTMSILFTTEVMLLEEVLKLRLLKTLPRKTMMNISSCAQLLAFLQLRLVLAIHHLT